LKLFPVSIVIFYRKKPKEILEVWTQVRENDGVYHGLLEFPGGGVESGESPLNAAVREVQEEVGISIESEESEFMGIYINSLASKTILLNVFLFPDQASLNGKGKWLEITKESLSRPLQGQIPGPNHQMIDDLYRSLYS
jgi:mutator protein MutT